MYNNDTELIFPSRVIEKLQDQRGKAWKKLVVQVLGKPETSQEHQAFVLMMARLDGCTTCNADSFRAMRGCTQCALQNIRRFREDDSELVKLYDRAKKDLEKLFKDK